MNWESLITQINAINLSSTKRFHFHIDYYEFPTGSDVNTILTRIQAKLMTYEKYNKK